MLSFHQADFCLISEREGDHNWILLRNDPMVALIPPGHPLAKETSVPMEAFAVESYIQTYPGQDVDNARIFSRCHITPNPQFSTMDINATYSMVEAGLGIGINNQVNSYLWAAFFCKLTTAQNPLQSDFLTVSDFSTKAHNLLNG